MPWSAGVKRAILCGLVLAWCATAPAAGEAAADDTALLLRIREELAAVRSRVASLEARLAPSEGSAGTAESAPIDQAAESVASVGAAAGRQPAGAFLNAATADPAASAWSDAEPSAEIPIGGASSGGQAISLTGLLDTYYTHNANRPADGQNALYYTNPNATGFGLNQAMLTIDAKGSGPIGFHADLWFGSGARLFRGTPPGPGPLQDLLYVRQAYGYYRFGNGAELDLGAVETFIGLEVTESHLNWNYSRGILWMWNEPATHLGAKLSVPVSDAFTSAFLLVNGFGLTRNNRVGKSYGVLGSFAPNDRFNTTLSWINGPQAGIRASGWLRDLSWNMYGGLHERFEVMANLDYIQAHAPGGPATSWGMGGYARGHLSARMRVAYRIEFLDDSQGRATGFEQNLREQTLTFEVQPVKDDPRFLTRLEWRRDWSDLPFFSCTGRRACDENGRATSQTTFTAGFMWVLGPK